jgi:hypothetical protein
VMLGAAGAGVGAGVGVGVGVGVGAGVGVGVPPPPPPQAVSAISAKSGNTCRARAPMVGSWMSEPATREFRIYNDSRLSY